jgi:hypothetical protein
MSDMSPTASITPQEYIELEDRAAVYLTGRIIRALRDFRSYSETHPESRESYIEAVRFMRAFLAYTEEVK